MIGHRRAPSIRMPKLAVRTSLANQGKVQLPQNPHHLARLENRSAAHESADGDGLSSYEFSIKTRLTILKEHGDNFLKVFLQFIEGSALGMRPGKTRNVTDIELGFLAPLDDGCEALHEINLSITSLRSSTTRHASPPDYRLRTPKLYPEPARPPRILPALPTTCFALSSRARE